MTNLGYILPMRHNKRIIFVIFPGFELLDLSGPAAVFTHANMFLDAREQYEICCASRGAGLVACSVGASISSVEFASLKLMKSDTVLALGAEEVYLRAALRDQAIVELLQRAARRSGRYGSVCVGAYLLGAAGLLDGVKATTHWEGCAKLQKMYPSAQIEDDALYVNDGNLWTSAGASAGIDMALAMLEADHGSKLMGQVAKRLVVYAHRPGYQSQFSTLLDAQSAADGQFSEFVVWLASQVGTALTVPDMAERVGMSERTFHRKFTLATGVTPAKYFEELCLQRAKVLLEAGEVVKQVATKVGFQSESAFRASFRSRFGITPRHHVLMHG